MSAADVGDACGEAKWPSRTRPSGRGGHRQMAAADTGQVAAAHTAKGPPRPARPLDCPPMTRVLSGIQPTGKKHLGNYIGAIRHYVADQYEADAYYCIVDLHAITVPFDPAVLRENTLDTGAMLLAAGLDPQRCTLFVQSHLHEHAEGAWLLGAVATMGELRRMTQFKDKSHGQDSVAVDLFTYPVLQAADILL